MKYVNQPVRKTDAMLLVTGKPVYTDDLAPKDCLIVKILRSPHANAWVEEIKHNQSGPPLSVQGIHLHHNISSEESESDQYTLPSHSGSYTSPLQPDILYPILLLLYIFPVLMMSQSG